MERLRVVPAVQAAPAVLLALGLALAPAPAAAADRQPGGRDRLLLEASGPRLRPVQHGPAPPQVAPLRRAAAAAADGDEVPWGTAALALPALAVALLGLGHAVQRHRRRRADAFRPPPVPVVPPPVSVVSPPVPDPGTSRSRALGYVRLASGAPSASFHAQAAAIETGCLAREMALVSLVFDHEPPSGSADRRPALAFALKRLAAGEADRLVVSRLEHLGSTADELQRLLDSMPARHAGIVVLDRGLDTAALSGPVDADALLAPTDPPPSPLVPRAMRAIDAHIASMLEEGASREDAVAALNAEPVPPPQGGRWSRSGVEAALRRRATTDTDSAEGSDA